MDQYIWKSKLSFLWLALAANYTSLLLSEAANGVITFPAGESTSQYVITIYYSIIIFIGLTSVLATPLISRWPNIVIAFLFLVLKIMGSIGILVPSSPGMVINELVGVLISAVIIWCAWKAPSNG